VRYFLGSLGGLALLTSFPPAGSIDADRKAFVSEIATDPGGARAQTLIAGTEGQDVGHAIAVDAAGATYVVGTTDSTEATFPDGDGFGSLPGPDTSFNGRRRRFLFKGTGDTDAFVVKISPSGTSLEYAGYVGGIGDDRGFGIAVDGSGAAYIVGSTESTEASFPNGNGLGGLPGPDTSHNGGSDAFVAKVSPSGTSLEYAGYVGGSGKDHGLGIAVDGSGAAHIVGSTESTEASFPNGNGLGGLPGPDASHNGGGADAFVAKVSPSGTSLEYAGYVGGAGRDEGSGIDVDASGDVYLSGGTASSETSFPDGDGLGPLPGPDGSFNGGSTETGPDAFVAKINSAGSSFVYAGYLGGSGNETGSAISVDEAGAAYIAGRTDSTEGSFPDGDGFGALPTIDATYNGGFDDAFVAKVSPSGTALAYAGYIGGTPAMVGSGQDAGLGIAVDVTGAAYVSGSTTSAQASFPDGDGFGGVATFDGSYNGGDDGFVAKVAPPGTSLEYIGYIGGRGQQCCTSDFEPGEGIAVDLTGAASVVGYTSSDQKTFPDGDGFGDVPGPDRTFNGGVKPVPQDAFIVRLASAGTSLVFAGYIGGSGADCDGRKGPELATHIGTSGRDLVVGSPRRDIIATFGGRDRVRGRAGKDFVCAGKGGDKLNGGPGNDRLEGEGGPDVLLGAGGEDRLKGGKRSDLCVGGAGRDVALRCERMRSVP